ncbi:MAG: DoxX family protein [Patescibacteria group bacterium]|nr:DoxX family protein [Patescibacteria group bacterium]
MALVFLIGRLILGYYWLETAYHHLFKSAGLIGYAQSKGVKSAKLAVIGSGLLALIGGLSILLGVRPHYGIAALVIFLIGVSWKMHAFWKIQDPGQKASEKIAFMKNMALAAAILSLVAVVQPWAYALNW